MVKFWYRIWWMKWLKNKASFYLSWNYSYILYFLMKMKEVKQPLHFSLLQSKLCHNKTETKKVKVANGGIKFIKTYDEYLCKFISGPIFGSIVLLLSAGEKQILKTLFWGEMGNIFLPGVVMIKSWGRVLLQGMSKQTKFFDLQMYFPVIITP